MVWGKTKVHFDESYYLLANPDVAAAVENGDVASGYDHWVAYGAKEGREPCALWFGLDVNDFDEQEYLDANPDIATAVANGEYVSGYEHFIKIGWREVSKGLRPINGKDKLRVLSRFQLKDYAFMMMNANLHKDQVYFRAEVNNWFTDILEKAMVTRKQSRL